MSAKLQPASDITIIYVSESGKKFTQPLSDIVESGTLIDPETGDDLALIGWIPSNETLDEDDAEDGD